ncbi:hypothetical protein Tco_1488715 [Tanacetum coccineum]
MKTMNIDNEWRNTIGKLAEKPCSNNIRIVVRKFVLSTCVYFIWRERNARIFTSEKKDANRLSKEIEESVRVQLMNIKGGVWHKTLCDPSSWMMPFWDVYSGSNCEDVAIVSFQNSLNGDAIVRNEFALSDTDFGSISNTLCKGCLRFWHVLTLEEWDIHMKVQFSGTIAERKCSLGTVDIHRVLGWIWKNSLNGDAIVRNELALSDTDFGMDDGISSNALVKRLSKVLACLNLVQSVCTVFEVVALIYFSPFHQKNHVQGFKYHQEK